MDMFKFFKSDPKPKKETILHTDNIAALMLEAINYNADESDTDTDRPSVRVVINTGLNTYDSAMVSSIRVLALTLGRLCDLTNIKPNAIFAGDDTHIVLRYDCDMAIRDTVARVYMSVINAINKDYKAVAGTTALDWLGYDATTDDYVLFYSM
mgnify:CR=1 FL=1